MTDLTEEEYDALDEYYTKNTIMPIGKPGFFASKSLSLGDVAPDTAVYLRTQAIVCHKTPAEIVDALVREKLTKSA
jgi:hypothetical protein